MTLNEAIATHIEPNQPPAQYFDIEHESPLEAWTVAVDPWYKHYWKPRAFDTDPACMAQLMRLRGFVGLNQIEDEPGTKYFYEAEFCDNEEHSLDCNNFGKAEHADPIRAIALAYARAHNLAFDEQEG